ncbi:hypothetical protein BpHYR1_006706, partial [Brachionus plicatilis]
RRARHTLGFLFVHQVPGQVDDHTSDPGHASGQLTGRVPLTTLQLLAGLGRNVVPAEYIHAAIDVHSAGLFVQVDHRLEYAPLVRLHRIALGHVSGLGQLQALGLGVQETAAEDKERVGDGAHRVPAARHIHARQLLQLIAQRTERVQAGRKLAVGVAAAYVGRVVEDSAGVCVASGRQRFAQRPL